MNWGQTNDYKIHQRTQDNWIDLGCVVQRTEEWICVRVDGCGVD